MENPQEATDYNGKTLDLWRRFLGIIADFPKETSPQPQDNFLSTEGLIRTSQEAANAGTEASRQATEDLVASRQMGVPAIEPSAATPPEMPQGSATPDTVPADLGLPGIPVPAAIETPAAAPVEPPAPSTLPIGDLMRRDVARALTDSVPPRPMHDLVGQPSEEDPFGQDYRERGILAQQRQFDYTREEMIDTYRETALAESDFRDEQLRVMRRMASDLGGDFRQLLDMSASYEFSRDTLTDSPL
jgi:hypothetical protein